jgi:hypothetical protein
VLDERGLENEVEMGWLEADEGTQQGQGLDTVLLLHKEFVEGEEEKLWELVSFSRRRLECLPLASYVQR